MYHATVCPSTYKDYTSDYIPDLIIGDLDSLDPQIRDYYENTMGVRVEWDGDQDCNDLDKALGAIRDRNANANANANASSNNANGSSSMQIYVYGAFGGRFDQEMASIQALYKWKDEFNYRIALYTDETCGMLLKPHARNEIRLPFFASNSIATDIGVGVGVGVGGNGSTTTAASAASAGGVTCGEGPTCGLIPIGCKCDGVETEGLKWNLDGSVPLEFGGLVSTSNRVEDDLVVVRCLQPLVFTAEIIQIR